jgi:hypothetical protein
MHFELEHTLIGAFTNLETPIFLSLLLPTGLIAYYHLLQNNQTFRRVAARAKSIDNNAQPRLLF